MPRNARPVWDDSRSQWTARVGPPRESDGRASLVRFPRFDEYGRSVGPKSERWAWAYLAKLQAGEVASPNAKPGPRSRPPSRSRPGSITLEDARELYLAHLDRRVTADNVSKRHRMDEKHRLETVCHLKPSRSLSEIGHWPLASLDHATLESLELLLLGKGLSSCYVRGLLRSLRNLMAWAAKPSVDRPPLVALNKLAGYRLAPAPKAEPKYADRVDAANWLRWLRKRNTGPCDKKYRRNFLLMQRFLIATGARPGEACRLRWADIHWDTGIAELDPTRWKSGRKTRRHRSVFLPARVLRWLRREFARNDRHPEAVFFHGPGRGGKGRDEPWADSTAVAKRMRQEREHAKKAGVVVPQTLTNYVHRHTAASNLAMAGVAIDVNAALLGTSREMLERVYIHVQAGALRRAAEKTRMRTKRPRSDSN